MSISLKNVSFEAPFSVQAPRKPKTPAAKDGRKLTRSLGRASWCRELTWKKRSWIYRLNSPSAEYACVKQTKNSLNCWPCSRKLWLKRLSSKRQVSLNRNIFLIDVSSFSRLESALQNGLSSRFLVKEVV